MLEGEDDDDEEEDDGEEEELGDETHEGLGQANLVRMNSRKIKQMIPQMFTDKDDGYVSSDYNFSISININIVWYTYINYFRRR